MSSLSRRSEMPMPFPDRNSEPASAPGMSIALIGPNQAHRLTMVRALADEARSVREFADYPVNLGELPRLLEQHFDVVMIDVDSDQGYAIKIIETITRLSSATTVMAYSGRNDQDLLMSCMRAGAQDFLPLPDDGPQAYEALPAAEGPEPGMSMVRAIDEPIPIRMPMTESPSEHLAPPPAALDEVALEEVTFDEAVEGPAGEESPAAFGFEDLIPPGALSPEMRVWDQSHLEQSHLEEEVQPPAGMASEPPPLTTSSFQIADFLKGGAGSSAAWDATAGAWRGSGAPDPAPQFTTEPPPPRLKSDTGPLPFSPDSALPFPESRAAVTPLTTNPLTTNPLTNFDAWDEAHLRGTKTGSHPIPAPVPSPRSLETPASVDTFADPFPAADLFPKTELPRVAAPVPVPAPKPFSFHSVGGDSTPENQLKWVIAAVLAGALVMGGGAFFYMRAHRPPEPSAAPSQADEQAPPEAADSAEDQAATTITPSGEAPPAPRPAKPAATARTPRPTPGVPAYGVSTPPPATQYSAAQLASLTAPSRFSNAVKSPAPGADQPPPASFSPGAIDAGGSMPAPAFNSHSRPDVVPAVTSISAGIAEGMLVKKTPPIYPKFAQDSHISGTVVIRATITRYGTLTNLRVVSGPKVLGDVALNAVKTWRYRPYLLNNEPVDAETTINVVFALDGR